MQLKGMSELRKHVPDLQKPGNEIRIGPLIAGVFILVTLFFIWVDRVFSEWMPDGEIIFIALGFLILGLFYSQKRIFEQKYGSLAYRNAFARFCIPGLGIIYASLAHLIYIPGPEIPNLWWKIILTILGWYFLLVGLILLYRTVISIGWDYLAMLYVYFPEEGRLLDTNIYGILRHPICAGLLDLGIGLALISGNWYALLVAALLPLGFTGWVRLVEEKELLQRFGVEYDEYRKKTPAFWAKPRDLYKFARFLLTGA